MIPRLNQVENQNNPFPFFSGNLATNSSSVGRFVPPNINKEIPKYPGKPLDPSLLRNPLPSLQQVSPTPPQPNLNTIPSNQFYQNPIPVFNPNPNPIPQSPPAFQTYLNPSPSSDSQVTSSTKIPQPMAPLINFHQNLQKGITHTIQATNKIVKSLQNSRVLEKIKAENQDFDYELKSIQIIMMTSNEKMNKMIEIINNYVRILESLTYEKWFYLDDFGNYLEYEQGICNIIENAFHRSYLLIMDPNYEEYSQDVTIQYSNKNWSVKFSGKSGIHCQVLIRENMESTLRFGSEEFQKVLNDKSNSDFNFDCETVRMVRRGGNASVVFKRPVYWYWRYNSRDYRPYEPEADYLIEHYYLMYKNGSKNAIVLIQGSNSKTYLIDFENMKQYNEKTRFRRSIKRISS